MSDEELSDEEFLVKAMAEIPPAPPIEPSKAKLYDALMLLRRVLRKCRIDTVDVIIIIPDPEVRRKLGNEQWGFGKKLDMLSETYNNINQFICRFGGVTIMGPSRDQLDK